MLKQRKNRYLLSRFRFFNNRFLGIFSLQIFLILIFIPIHGGTFADHPSPVSLTTAEKDWLKNHATDIKLCYNSNLPPIEFSDDADKFIGLSADVFALVEKKLGVNLKKKKTIIGRLI